jgi:2-polyprenyl-3-methyl-5-hydroxy-6-metoxy-1,4-benzoquinol methylase
MVAIKEEFMSEAFVNGRGKFFCRGCNSDELFSALNLGNLPIANELWPSLNEEVEEFPLHLRICKKCGLGQVEDVVTPTRLFKDYRYLSSVSSSFIEHAKNYVDRMINELNITKNDWVLEIASNDGYLLKNFVNSGITVLGVEPAENVAKIAIRAGIPTISEFFGRELALKLLNEHGHPKLIIANNVMAHVPDIRDFMRGLALIAGPETIITVENPSLMNLLKKDQFDTIYHEHYSYLTAHSVRTIGKEVSLELIKVEEIGTHGGSNRYWLQILSPKEVSDNVSLHIASERNNGLFDENSWKELASRIEELVSNFRNWLEQSHKDSKIVCGYGAAAKASTLLNYAKIKPQWLPFIADESHEKQGRFMPSKGIKIVSSEDMFLQKPTDIVIFPWNLSSEIGEKIKSVDTKLRIWQAVPKLQRVL